MFGGTIFVDEEGNRPLTDAMLAEAIHCGHLVSFAKQAIGIDSLVREYDLIAGGTVRCIDSYYLQAIEITPPPISAVGGEGLVEREEYEKFIFSAQWNYGQWIYGSVPQIKERNEYTRGSKSWEYRVAENAAYDEDAEYNADFGFANWFSTDGEVILSWCWPAYVARYEDPINPYNASYYGDVYLWEGVNRKPVVSDAPYAIIGACVLGGMYVLATQNGIFYRKDETWLLVSGSTGLFTDMQGEDGPMPVRFSGSGTQGVCVVTAVATGQTKKLLFTLSYDENLVAVSLAGSSREDSADYNDTPIGSCTTTSNHPAITWEITSYTPPPDPSYPEPECGASYLCPDSVGHDPIVESTIGWWNGFWDYQTPDDILFVYGKRACTHWQCTHQNHKDECGASFTPNSTYPSDCNSTFGLDATEVATRHADDSSSGSITPIQVLYAADWDGEELVECFIELASFSYSTASELDEVVTTEYVDLTPSNLTADNVSTEGSDSYSFTRNRQSYIVIKKGGNEIIRHSLLVEHDSVATAGSWSYVISDPSIPKSTPGYVTGGKTITQTETYSGNRLSIFGLDLRSQTILAVEVDMNVAANGSAYVPYGENEPEFDISLSWGIPTCIVINPSGSFTKEIPTNTTSWNDTYNHWYTGLHAWYPCHSGDIDLLDISPDDTWFTYQPYVTTTPNGDALFSYESGGLWYPWSPFGWFHDWFFGEGFEDVESIVAIQGIFDSEDKRIIPLSEVHPEMFIDADGNEAGHSFNMTSYYGDNALKFVGQGDYMRTHKNTL